MKIKDLFHVGDPTGSFSGTDVYLDRDNCQIINKTKNNDAVILHLKRVSDNQEGQSYLRVRKGYDEISRKLLNWAFINSQILNLTLNQLGEFETGLSVESLNGRLIISGN